MSEQAQCPNCGGYKVSDKSHLIDSTTGKKIPPRLSGCLFLLIAIAGSAILFFCLWIVMAFFAFDETPDWILVFILAIAVSFFIWSMVEGIREGKKIDSMLLSARKLHEYYCYICGYSWKWIEGDPKPEIQANLGLLAKGSQRLEEEIAEEERRKEEEDFMMMQRLRK